MILTPMPSSVRASSMLRCFSDRRLSPCTHQTHAWVSNKITGARPSPLSPLGQWDACTRWEHLAGETRPQDDGRPEIQRSPRLAPLQGTADWSGEPLPVHQRWSRFEPRPCTVTYSSTPYSSSVPQCPHRRTACVRRTPPFVKHRPGALNQGCSSESSECVRTRNTRNYEFVKESPIRPFPCNKA
jgi:hypothetical protein